MSDEAALKLDTVPLRLPEGTNVIFGHSHFIKTVEDLHEICATSVPQMRFAVAFSEASQEALVRRTGNDNGLVDAAVDNVRRIGCGHCFLIIIQDAFPIHLLNAVKACPEVCRIFCATGNPVEVIVARGPTGGAVLGVIDGLAPAGVENDEQARARMDFLRTIGHKLG